MPVSRPESSGSRVIAHIDMDCFYVQVEQRKQPHLKGQPTAVVQYNRWKGGGLIAVSYEARSYGVKRSMRGDDAKQVCPDIKLVQVPVARGKADLTVYRNAGSEVVSVLAKRGLCERASIDEVYLDLTEAAEAMLADTLPGSFEAISEEALKSHVLGLEADASNNRDSVRNWFMRSHADHRDKLLACGAIIVAELRLQVLKETGFTCSAGIAHNKMLAKLSSGMNKPAQQTVVPSSSVENLLEFLPIKKMKRLGGKLGTSLQTDLCVNTVGDLLKFSEEKLQQRYGINTGTWLWNTARGISGEEVRGRLLPKSHGAGKTFPGAQALKTIAGVEKWLKELCAELCDRLHSDLEQNKRIAHTLTLHATAFKVSDSDSVKKFPSKSCSLRFGVSKIQEDALMLFQAGLREYLGSFKVQALGNQCKDWRITGLSVSASKIVAIPSGTRSIMNYFNNQDKFSSSVETSNDSLIQEALPFAHSEETSNDKFIEEAQPLAHSGRHFSIGGSCSDLFEPEIGSIHENNRKECTTTESYQGEDRENVHVASCIQDHIPNQQKEGFRRKELISSAGGHCLGPDETESNIESNRKEFACSEKSEEQKVMPSKEKGKASILRFFHKHNSCSSNQEHVKVDQENRASSYSGADSHSLVNICSGNMKDELPQINPPAGTQSEMETYSLDRDENSNSWLYRIDEIDPAVLNELPLQIQEEVRAWLRPQKRANTVKRGSSIVDYFPPRKES